MPAAKEVEATQPFVTEIDGRKVVVAPGDRFKSSDPVVKGREGLFGPVTTKDSTDEPAKKAAG